MDTYYVECPELSERKVYYATWPGHVTFGPYKTEKDAWDSLTLTDDVREGGCPYPAGSFVYPIWVVEEAENHEQGGPS